MGLPSSRALLGRHLGWFDVLWAMSAPFAAFALRDTNLLVYESAGAVPLFLICSAALSLIALHLFRVRDGVASFFAWRDALDILKAGIFVATLTCTILFTLTRLDGVPRSLPLIHAALFVSGLILARIFTYVAASANQALSGAEHKAVTHAIVIGANKAAFSYIKLVQACAPGSVRVMALLDERGKLAGRRISGIPILGSPADLEAVIDEFVVHGISINRVLVAGGANLLEPSALGTARAVCQERSIRFDTLSELAGLWVEGATLPQGSAAARTDFAAARGHRRHYPSTKRLIDVAVSAVALFALMPVLAAVSLLVRLGIGAPVLFWQQRLGTGGRSFLVYKFRTLGSPFDAQGRRVPDERRLSALGRFLRRTHLDELPQLLNILKGDMSLVGPRPLLAIDQPADPSVRLSVRPGMTGWAQINGGKALTIAEKNALDEWYVRNASLRVDWGIVLSTIQLLVAREGAREHWERDATKATSARLTPATIPGASAVPVASFIPRG